MGSSSWWPILHTLITDPGPHFSIKTFLPGIGFTWKKLRRSWDRLIFIMGIPTRVRRHLYIETVPSSLRTPPDSWTGSPAHMNHTGLSMNRLPHHEPLARYVKLQVAHAPGMPGTFSPPPRVNDPDMHHGTCVPWCMPGSLTSGFPLKSVVGKTFPAIPAHAQLAILRIW